MAISYAALWLYDKAKPSSLRRADRAALESGIESFLDKYAAESDEVLYANRRSASRYTLAWFPHTTNRMIDCAAEEFCDFGIWDAFQRGITGLEWLWRRTKWMAASGAFEGK